WDVGGHAGGALRRRNRAHLGCGSRCHVPAVVHRVDRALWIREPPRKGKGVPGAGGQDRVLVLKRESAVIAEQGDTTRRRRPGAECRRQVAVGDLRGDGEAPLNRLADHRTVELHDDWRIGWNPDRTATRIEGDDLRGAGEKTPEGAEPARAQ